MQFPIEDEGMPEETGKVRAIIDGRASDYAFRISGRLKKTILDRAVELAKRGAMGEGEVLVDESHVEASMAEYLPTQILREIKGGSGASRGIPA
jgi:hypothetical protein